MAEGKAVSDGNAEVCTYTQSFEGSGFNAYADVFRRESEAHER